jgi:hypothetical protein
MNNDKQLVINYAWIESSDKDALLQWTSANLYIYINGKNATYNVNTESKSTHDSVTVAMYPLALWIARCWWRLIYETGSLRYSYMQNPFWRIAHELTTAGEGYVWPDLTFVSDGDCVRIMSRKTNFNENESGINYLNEFASSVPN